ncbi:MAG: DUF348 domain-containing protein, partial [Chloroflexi bacterium]|nr:DUF348 domain-containing protein [Chloroflexota bacterium]
MDVFYPIRRATTAPRPWFSGRLRLWLGIGLLAMTVLGGALLLQQRLIKVTVSVDGRERTVYTLQRDVTRFLSSRGYEAHAQDIIAVSAAQLQNGARIEIHPARPLLISVDGQQHQVWTQAESVGEALQEGGIKLGWRDQVWMEGKLVQANTVLPPRQWLPPAGNKPHMPWDGELQAVRITLRRASPLVVIDGEGVPATLLTTAPTIGEALSEAQVPIYLGDTVFPPLSARVQPGLRVVIRRSLPIAISVEGETYATRTQQSTVGDALAEQGVSLFGLDETEPALSTPLRPYATIRIVRVREEVQYEEEYLPYETIWVPDDNLPIDQRRVNQSGATGIKRLRYRVRFEDGKEVARELEDEWLAVTPETKV